MFCKSTSMLNISLIAMLQENHGKVSLEDFELLKVLGTGGMNYYNYTQMGSS